MTEEDVKLFELTKSNTITNRDILKKDKEYMKNIEPKYKEIYGDKVTKFCEEESKNESINASKNQNEQIEKKKRRRKIKFSSIVEYSRN